MEWCSVQEESLVRPAPLPTTPNKGMSSSTRLPDPPAQARSPRPWGSPAGLPGSVGFLPRERTVGEAKIQDDRTLKQLDKILEEHASLRALVQQQHEILSQRIEGISLSLSSSPLIKMSSALQSAQTPTAGSGVANNGASAPPAVKNKVQVIKKDEVKKPPPPSGCAPAGVKAILQSNAFELTMSMVILANTGTMFASLQLKGMHESWRLGLRSGDADWDTHKVRLQLIESVFNGIYLAELVLRLWVQGFRFVRFFSNIMDGFVVLFSCLDCFVLQPLSIKTINISVLRLVRLTRVLRVAKFLRFSENLSELRVLIRTLYVALRGIIWSVVLLSGIIVAGGILMAQLAQMYVDDPSVDLKTREWLSVSFGTTMASMHTMFECTFSGGWRFYSRPLVEEVSYIFAPIWVVWVIIVNFMTMRVVGALFLKQTMAVSAHDDEMVVMDQMKLRGQMIEDLRRIFQMADTSGDGNIGKEEFDKMLSRPDVVEQFGNLGLDMDEVTAFFCVLTSDDGYADYDEFIQGALAMSTSSPTLDAMKSLHNQMKMAQDIDLILEIVQPLRKLKS